MIVCICHRVSDRDIAHAAREGCESFDELQDHLRVATACGACHDCARETFEQHAAPAGSHGVGVIAAMASAACAAVPITIVPRRSAMPAGA